MSVANAATTSSEHMPTENASRYAKPSTALRVAATQVRIAAMTGGGYYELRSPANLGPTFKRIADELHKQYALAFTPDKLDGKTHKIEVRIKRPDLVARARKTYVARKDM